MLGADVAVVKQQRFAKSILQDSLALRRKRDLASHDPRASADDGDHLTTDFLDRDFHRVEHAGSQALLFAQEPEQEVLGVDGVMLKRPCLVLCEDHDLARPR